MPKVELRSSQSIHIKKKVVILSPLFNLNILRGSERVNYSVAQLLSANGFDVTVLTSTLPTLRYFIGLFNGHELPTNECIHNIKIIRLRTNKVINTLWHILNILNNIIPISQRFPYGVYFNKSELIKLLQNIQPDIIYSSNVPFYHNEVIASLGLPNIIIRTEIHPNQKLYTSIKNKDVLKNTYMIQTSTHAEKKLLKTVFHIKDNKIIVIPPLIDKVIPHNMGASRPSYFDFTGKKVVLFVGKKNNDKGCINVLKAVKKLWKTDNNYVLVVAGETSLEWKMNKLIYNGPFLTDLDWISEQMKEELFSKCTVFCMPSKVESFGIVYIEAWRRKKPVIALRSIISEEMIGVNKRGIIVDVDTVDQLALAIKTIIDNVQLAKKLGENGYRLFRREYERKKNESKYLSLFSYDKKNPNKK